ncbi:Cyclin-d1-1 [Thalictrum thalictroides]|uniref:Cyclin-d1-1 n=1 Tax=Thalictrum thalictroides TaxID=46969 RepID=A0A7J6WTD5_THATH|nr:Cyclin-d1-1 [Thalictrum thalictroides]
MSSSYSDCFSDLICDEDVDVLTKESPEYFQEFEFPDEIEESIARFVEGEGDYVPRFDYPSRFESHLLDASARQQSVAWILKVQAFYRFQPLTAYLSVNYMDRFLASHGLPDAKGWPLQLLSIACLSLAAKMEEPLVPSLVDLQVEGTKFIFEPRTICRMELLVLTALDWRLRSITPFTFIDYFASKIDSSGSCIGFLISRATEVILNTIRGINFLDYSPSSVAVASIIHAAKELPNLSIVTPGNAVAWCQGLSKDRIMECSQLMQEVVVGQKLRKPPKVKVLPQHRVMTHTDFDSGDSSSSSSSFSSKRRKLNNYNSDNDNL